MRSLYRLAILPVFAAGFAFAQTGMQNPPTTPPTFPSQQQPGAQRMPPDENAGQPSPATTTAITKAQADIQTALRRQMPATADSVTVSTTDDNKILLNGTVTSETEKSQVEQIARNSAPDLDIVNRLTVAGGPVATPPTGAPPNPGINPEGKTGTEKSPQQTTPRQPMPPMGSSFMAGQAGSPQTNPGSQQPAGAASTGNSTDVQSNIQKALQQDPTLASANITVNVNGNKVELTGTVASKDEKNTAKQIAESNAGGLKVVDHLKVEHSKAGKENATPPKY